LFCSQELPDSTAEPETLENAFGTGLRTLPGPENHGSIPEILFHPPFPRPGKILALRPVAGTDFLVVLSVRAVQPESLDSYKRASPDTREFASIDTMPNQLRNQSLTLAGCHPA